LAGGGDGANNLFHDRRALRWRKSNSHRYLGNTSDIAIAVIRPLNDSAGRE
jgi:hypothetical protein